MLQVEKLKKSFKNKPVLKGLDLDLNPGETLVLMGPSGCGKSTTIRCINLLLPPDGGKIIFKGKNLIDMEREELREYRQKIGFVFQQFNLIGRLCAIENVMLPLLEMGKDKKEARDVAENALLEMGLSYGHQRRPAELSGGEQQRVALARALALNPDLILLDEPTSALDPILVKEVLEGIEALARSERRGIILVTHEVTLARKIADRILLLSEGEVVEEGTPGEIFSHPRSWVGRRYKEISEYQ